MAEVIDTQISKRNTNKWNLPLGGILPDIDGLSRHRSGLPFDHKDSSIMTQQGLQNRDSKDQGIREPLLISQFIIKILRFPLFYKEDPRRLAKIFFEDNVKEVSGPPQNSIEIIETTHGVTAQPNTHAGMYKKSGNELTIKCPETSGSPVSKLLDYHLSGISDPETGIRHLWGYDGLRTLRAYSFDFIVVFTGPSGRPDDIEYSYIFCNAFPTEERTSHYMGARGEPGSGQEFDIPLKGQFMTGTAVDRLGKAIVAGSGLYNETREDLRLPTELYEKILASTTELRSAFGDTFIERFSGDEEYNNIDNQGKISEFDMGESYDYSTADSN